MRLKKWLKAKKNPWNEYIKIKQKLIQSNAEKQAGSGGR